MNGRSFKITASIALVLWHLLSETQDPLRITTYRNVTFIMMGSDSPAVDPGDTAVDAVAKLLRDNIVELRRVCATSIRYLLYISQSHPHAE